MGTSDSDAATDDAALYRYSEGVAPFIDLCTAGPEVERPELPFLRTRVPVGGSVLDIGAGVGELAFQLAANGFHVTALEPDAGMYGALLVRLAPRADLQATLTPVPRAAGFDLQQHFDACLALAVLHHLDGAARRALFRYAAAHLRAGGLLVVDAPVESAGRAEVPHQLRSERVFGVTRFQHWHAVRRTPGGWQTIWEFVTLRGASVLDRRSRLFEWTPSSLEEVTACARAAGLEVEAALGGFDGTTYAPGESRSLIAVARKTTGVS